MVDLTYPFDENAAKYPIFKSFEFQVTVNESFPNGVWIQSEEYSSTTHAGTHMDAPAHFVPAGTTIDQIKLDRFIGPAAVIDIAQRAAVDPDTEVTVGDLLAWEELAGRTLDGTIIFMRSGWGAKYRNATAYYGTPDNDVSKLRFPGFSPEAARWLVENRNIRGTGVDTLSLDRGISEDFWAHRMLLGNEIFILENVANLEKMPLYGATVYVMPMKIAGASGAPTRVVATYPDLIFNP
ncbi:hypothetical protein JTE90_025454 [Oedothorax gibbosus]|uniref:Cyclase n=1 Tax=Oedothorax gibbosus TaxID=931172 RepID=A0AAV6U4S7_9ARAC|nr:hypothetical protein JTE90_025454 [Oedothorax gibbosus]